jgi:3-dehydroquinate synthase
MKRIRLEVRGTTDRSYDIVVGRGILAHIHNELEQLGRFSSLGLVTDEHVAPLAAKPLLDRLRSHKLSAELITLPAGETAKTMLTVEDLCQQLLAHGFDRQSLLLAVGGGVVGDITGFAAAIFMRGINYVQVPTTLLAQVDSAIGGKTGVDLPAGKNLLGAFHQPRLVLSDPDVLASLPPDARREGLAEVIKTALIGDPQLFSILEREGSSLLDFDNPILETIIAKSCRVKCRVVSQDEQEGGLRRILNFGHTFGHALEAASHFGVPHGQAVAIGMGIALQLSEEWCGLANDVAARALSLIRKVGLPLELPGDTNFEAVLSALERDKKIEANVCHLILLEKIGQPAIHPIPIGELRRRLEVTTTQ